MKKTKALSAIKSFSLIAAISVLAISCKQENKESAGAAAPAKSSASAPAAGGEKGGIVSAEKNSFQEVAAHLDPGGSFYLYLGTEQMLSGLSGKVTSLRQFLTGFPGIPADEQATIGKVVDFAAGLIKNCGLEEISGVGMSSIARAPGLYYSKSMLHHYPGKNLGYLWSLSGKSPHALDGLDLLPASTAFATFTDLDLAMLWSIVQKEAAKLAIPDVDKILQEVPGQFEAATAIKFSQLLTSLGGEYGFVLTLDESKKIAIPLGPSQVLQIPEPALMIVIRVKDDTIFNRVEKLAGENPDVSQQIIRVDKDGLRMRTLPVPLPLPVTVRPTWARYGDYLIISSSDALVLEAVAVKTGKKPGWKSSDEFKKLSAGVPAQGNNFFCLSAKFGETFLQIQKQAMNSAGALPAAQTDALQKLFGSDKPSYSYGVGANTSEGWLSVANSSQDSSKALLASVAVVPIGLMAAIAIPNFVKARDAAQHNACSSNLRLIDGAKAQWALENRKAPGAMPAQSDLVGPGKYLPSAPVCPTGGSYTFNAVGKPPSCSQHGSLPQ